MNKLFIIGNGFDLAHGLKTSYKDFLLWYVKKCVDTLWDKPDYQDEMIRIKRRDGYQYSIPGQSIDADAFDSVIEIFSYLDGNDSYWDYDIPSPFFEVILKSEKADWVNIENIYYQFLSGLIKEKQSQKSKEAILILNSNMDFIRDKLIEYLKENCCEFQFNLAHNKYQKILGKVDSYDENTNDGGKEAIKTGLKESNSLFVNFNYTPLVEKYFNSLDKQGSPFELIQIHGSIEKPNSIVFGFGDELDDVYLEMERQNNNDYFKHIKSFKYFQDENYQNLMSFVEAEPFEVIVLGHSLGLSDRTMLSQIFEHKNLEKVQLYYYDNNEGNNDFTEKTQEISRHFSDKGRMRLKVVPFTRSRPMPQLNITNNIHKKSNYLKNQ